MFAYISFCGFYYSILDLDSEIESYFERLTYEESEEKAEFIRDNTEFNYSEIRERIATKYVELYNDRINDLCRENDLPEVNFTFAGIDSPREYNFTTDALKVELHSSDLKTCYLLAECVKRNSDMEEDDDGYTFAQYVRERMKPRSGFIPYYSQDVKEWGDVSTWGLAQTEILFDFLFHEKLMCDENYHFYDLVEKLGELVYDGASCPEYVGDAE